MLPGASSTQTVMLIAMKRGGTLLAILSLLLWILPAFIIMSAFSFLVYYLEVENSGSSLFIFITPMSVGFVFFAALRLMQKNVVQMAPRLIMLGSFLAICFIHSPWVFPVVLVLAGTVSNFSSRRIPATVARPRPIRWVNLWLFAAIFLLAGVLSEVARVQGWPHRRVYNLFENFYRFGSIVFGGGQALLPMMLYQFVALPQQRGLSPWLAPSQLLTGYGIVQAVPGPVFTVCTFAGGMALSGSGPWFQALGCLVSTVAVFLPSTLLLFFLFPIFQNLKQHVIIFRALEGINAAIVGIIWASGVVLLQSVSGPGWVHFSWSFPVVIAITFCLLQFTKVPAPLIVLAWLLLGWCLPL